MNIEKIKKILSEKQYLSSKDIMELVGCSRRVAEKLKETTMLSYMPAFVPRARVRTDKFIDCYDNKQLTRIYKSLFECENQDLAS